MNKTIVKIGGVVAIILGSGAMYLSGVGESTVLATVSGVFVLAGIIASIFTSKK